MRAEADGTPISYPVMSGPAIVSGTSTEAYPESTSVRPVLLFIGNGRENAPDGSLVAHGISMC